MGTTSSIDTKFYGFRIYKLNENGPLGKFNSSITTNTNTNTTTTFLHELEDFIIPPNNLDKTQFSEFIQSNADKEVEFNIYSIKTRTFRSIKVKPSLDWCSSINNTTETTNTQNTSLIPNKGYLGTSVRYENWAIAHKNVLKIIKIKSNSISAKNNLKIKDDFIIAVRKVNADIISLNQEEYDPLKYFSNIMEEYKEENVEIIMYNKKEGIKSIVYNASKDKELGCDVAYGKLHEFPQDFGDGDELVEAVDNSNNESKDCNNDIKESINKKKDNKEVVVDNKEEREVKEEKEVKNEKNDKYDDILVETLVQ